MLVAHRASHPLRTPVSASPIGRLLLGIAAVVVGVALSGSSIGKLVALAVVGVLVVRWPLDRLIVAFTVLTLAADDPASRPYNDLWISPVQNIAAFWFDTVKKSVPFIPIPASPIMLVALVLLVRAATRRTGPRMVVAAQTHTLPATLRPALTAAFLVVGAGGAWGFLRGGSVQQMYYQVAGMVIALCLVGAVSRVMTPALAALLCRVLVYIALYRAALAIWIYLTIARGIEGDPPLYLTSHADSLLWAVAVTFLISSLVEGPTRATRWTAIAGGLVLGLAIIVNNRRIAWVIVFGAIVYIVFSASNAARRRLTPILIVAGPLIVAYIVLALGAPPSRVFAPVQSVQSVITGEDRSSQTRDIENFNVIFTMKSNVPFPTGFGVPYVELVRADDISAQFEQYLYLPHNSVLAMLTYLGPFGFALMVLPFMLAIRAAHDLRRTTQVPAIRTQSAVIMAAWIAFVGQAWGDLGFFTSVPTVLLGLACGMAIGLRSHYLGDRPRHR